MEKPQGFQTARKKAEQYLEDVDKTMVLLDKAADQADKQRSRIAQVWHELNLLIKMVRAWMRREYRNISAATVLAALAALIYFVNPFDLVPDFIFGLGYLDDASVILMVYQQLRKDLDKFAAWYELNRKTISITPEQGNTDSITPEKGNTET